MSDAKSILKDGARGALAAKIRQRKFALSKKFGIPEDLLPGSLCLTHSRCGRKACHCAAEQGHPVWLLTFMVEGKKRVERIPQEWVEQVRRRVDAGRAFKEAVAEVFAANAQLLALWRRQTRGRRR
jgi:hypothetical protein